MLAMQGWANAPIESAEKEKRINVVVSGNGQSPYAFDRQGCSNFKQTSSARPVNIAGDNAIDV
jgi:hypothetical protein